MNRDSSPRTRHLLVEKSGVLHIYYANKPFKHWKKRWLHLQDQELSIYQDSRFKHLEKILSIDNYRVSITNPSDSISQKGYNFKIYPPTSEHTKPIYFAADSKQSMTQWINALRLSASIAPDLLVESHLMTDLHPIDTASESDYDGSMNIPPMLNEIRSYKPSMPVAVTSTHAVDPTRLMANIDDGEDDDETRRNDPRWHRPRSSSPPTRYPSTFSNATVLQQSSATTMGSWGFDVNRSANGQTSTHHDHRTITRPARRIIDQSTDDYFDSSSSPPPSHPPPSSYPTASSSGITTIIAPPPQRFKLRTPILNRRNREGTNEVTVVDRLVLGPSRIVQSDYYPLDESPRQTSMSNPIVIPPPIQSRQSSTRSILRRRSKSIGDFLPTSPLPPTSMSQSYHPYHDRPEMSSIKHPKSQAEHELIAWQNRMLEREHRRVASPIVTRSTSTNPTWSQSPQMSSKRGGYNTSHSSTRPMPATTRPVSAMSNLSENQRFEHDHIDPKTKTIRVIKRYIELIYHLQNFYNKITEQLYGGNTILRNNSSQQTIFNQHCRKIAEQLQRSRSVWDRKMIDLQHLLKDLSTHPWSTWKTDTTFLQRRSNLLNLLPMFNNRKDIDETQLTILNDIERVLHEDKLAVQLQDELSTLLQHQSLLNDFTSLFQWNRQIYSPNEQNRVESVLPLLREQISTADGYVSHVSQQLTDLVNNLRSLEKYILSYVDTMPWTVEGDSNVGLRSSSRTAATRSYNENDVDCIKHRIPIEREHDEYQRSPRYQTRPLSMHTPTNPSYYQNGESPIQRTHHQHHHYNNENAEWRRRRSPSPTKTRSISMSRYPEPPEPVRGPSTDHLDRDVGLRTSSKWSPRRSNIHLNTNNSNNNPNSNTTRVATVKPARRENGVIPNSILKPYPSIRSTLETRKDFDIDTIDKEIFKPDKVDIPDRLIDFGNDEQILTPNERAAKIKKKEEVRKMLSKQSMQDVNEQEFSDGTQFHSTYQYRRVDKERERALNLQAALAEEAKEKSRQVAAKHYLNKSYQQRATRLNV